MTTQELFLLEKDAARMSDQLREITLDTDALLTKLSETPEAAGSYNGGLLQMQLRCQLSRYADFTKKTLALKERLESEADALSDGTAKDRARVCAASLSQLILLAEKETGRLSPLSDTLQMAGKAHTLSRESEKTALLGKLKQALSDKPDKE
jgi:hypothetical protein